MTYCVALRLDRGLVFAADTRTNAGVDNIATFSKMHVWGGPSTDPVAEVDAPDRVMVLMSAGNLAVTQAVVSVLDEAFGTTTENPLDLKRADTLFQAAQVVGRAIREVYSLDGEALEQRAAGFAASFILGGQVRGESPRLFQIYAEGNFIEATPDTPYLQIGEHKYGKPILDRVAHGEMRLGEAAKLLLVSFDSTLRSNLSVGMPIDLLAYEEDSFRLDRRRRLDADDDYFRRLSQDWSEALRQSFADLEELDL